MDTRPQNAPPPDGGSQQANRDRPAMPPGWDPRTPPSGQFVDPRWQRVQEKAWRARQKDQAKLWAAQSRAAARAQRDAVRAQMEVDRHHRRMYLRMGRQASVIGPILLIGIGVLFLLVHTGHIAVPAFLHWYAQWWPLVLIATGVIRLIEWGVDRITAPAGTPVRSAIGGGVVFLLVLVAASGLAMQGIDRSSIVWDGGGFSGWHGHGFQQMFEDRHEQDDEPMIQPISGTGTLQIDDPHGDVAVAGTSDDGRLHISVHKEAFTESDGGATQRFSELTPVLTGAEESRVLTVPSVRQGSADLDILVPSGVHVRVNSDHGDVRVNNLKAPVAVTANHGDVEVAGIAGEVTVHVNHRGQSVNVRNVNGRVEIAGSGDEANITAINGSLNLSGDFFGGGHLQHITGPIAYQTGRITFSIARLPGEVEMDGGDSFSASEAVGPVTVNTRNRNVSLARVSGDVSVTDNHGDVTVVQAPPNGNLLVANQNGTVTVTLPSSAHFTVEAETSDGNVNSQFDGASQQGSGVLRGAVNGGGPAVRITTSRGDIHLERNEEAPIPPPSPEPILTLPAVPEAPAPPAPAALPKPHAQTASKSHREPAAPAKPTGPDWQ